MKTTLLCLIFSALASQAKSPHPPFLKAPFWDDGKAEVSVFEAKRFHYGNLYPSEVRHYLVKEPFSSLEHVKNNTPDSPDTIPAIKLNQIFSTPTGTYTYQQMMSLFWSKTSGQLLKFAMSHHEACGATYKQGIRKNNQLSIDEFTYWQGQSKIHKTIPVDGNTWLYEELPLRARILVANSSRTPLTLQLIPPVLHSKADRFKPVKAHLSIDKYTVTVNHPGGRDILRFSPQWPHPLQSWQQADGGSLLLKKTIRIPYWNHHAPGEESLLK